MNKFDKFILVDKCKNFVRFIHKISCNYPRSEYLLKDQLTKTTFEVLELIITTNLISENRVTNKKIIIECPYCKSANTTKIPTTAKVVNTAIFGIFGTKKHKQWHCNECGSDF